jgi:hypothetical protein
MERAFLMPFPHHHCEPLKTASGRDAAEVAAAVAEVPLVIEKDAHYGFVFALCA